VRVVLLHRAAAEGRSEVREISEQIAVGPTPSVVTFPFVRIERK